MKLPISSFEKTEKYYDWEVQDEKLTQLSKMKK